MGPDVVADTAMSQSARRSSRCVPSGETSPACSARVHPFDRGNPATSPETYSRTRRRGSARPNRPVTRPTKASNSEATTSSTTTQG